MDETGEFTVEFRVAEAGDPNQSETKFDDEETSRRERRARRAARRAKEPSLEHFVELVAANKLVPRAILDALVSGSRFKAYRSAREFAASLVEGGHLTRWQAGRLLAGQSGFRLGKYKLVDRIGAGGMGVVLKAEHTHMRKIVAIKVLSRTLLRNDIAVRRFEREVEAASSLDHPNIVRALDADCIDGMPFLVMEYVEGKDLGSLVTERGPLPVELACEFCRQTALGLEHAAKRGLVHRDIKPANLLLTRKSPQQPLEIKILDFGLARFSSETPAAGDITSTDRIMGTVDFIAPEQARNAKQADIRSDIYSLGCTLYYLLAANAAYMGENAMEKLAARLLGPPTPITEYRPDLPKGLVALIDRMLAAEPANRFQSPAEVVAALDRFAAAEAVASVKEALEVVPRDEEGIGKLPSELALEHFLDNVAEADEDGTVHDASGTVEKFLPPKRSTRWSTAATITAVTLAIAFVLIAIPVVGWMFGN